MNYGIIFKTLLIVTVCIANSWYSLASKIPSAVQNIEFSPQLFREIHFLPLIQTIRLTYHSLMMSLFCCSSGWRLLRGFILQSVEDVQHALFWNIQIKRRSYHFTDPVYKTVQFLPSLCVKTNILIY